MTINKYHDDVLDQQYQKDSSQATDVYMYMYTYTWVYI